MGMLERHQRALSKLSNPGSYLCEQLDKSQRLCFEALRCSMKDLDNSYFA